MHIVRLRRRRMVVTFAAIGIGVLLQATVQRYDREREALVLARMHIVDRVEPLCRQALPQEDRLLFLAAPVSSAKTDAKTEGGAARLWTVECLNAQGESRLRLLWNDADACLVSLYRLNLRPPRLPRPLISQAQAVGEARLWIERLGIAPRLMAQQCAASAETESGGYDIHLRLPGQSATVCINAYSNDLRFVYVTRPGS